MNGFVVADPRRCIGCFACQAACVETHRKVGLQAYPRLIVTHTPYGTMPLQCHQCDYAACVAVCPVRALRYKDNTVQLNETVCIGCKMCGLACPFGAIIPGGTPVPNFEFNVVNICISIPPINLTRCICAKWITRSISPSWLGVSARKRWLLNATNVSSIKTARPV